jgi:hypothetical protein
MIVGMLRVHAVEIAAFQEFHSEQVVSASRPCSSAPCKFGMCCKAEYLKARLSGEYEMYGRGRDRDGTDEFQPIFWSTARFELVASGVFWLSEDPDDAGSHGWDGA